MKRYTLLFLCFAVIVAMTMVATACSTAGIEKAEAQKWDAKARADAAAITAQVPIIEAETNAVLAKMREIADIDKEMRAFDAQMARQEFATVVLEFQALNLAIREETEAAQRATAELMEVTERADGVGHNALAAARNTFIAAWVLAVIGVVVVGYGALLAVVAFRFGRRFDSIADELQKSRDAWGSGSL